MAPRRGPRTRKARGRAAGARSKTRTPRATRKPSARTASRKNVNTSPPPAPARDIVAAVRPAPAAETLLLALARELTSRAHEVRSPEQFRALVVAAFAAYGPDSVLASALREDWLRGRGDKAARLALGWAREQVRLALVDALVRARAVRLVRTDTDVETLGWLWLAACEALAHEVPGAATDRVQTFAAFLGAS